MLCCAGVDPCSFTSVPPPLWRGLGRGGFDAQRELGCEHADDPIALGAKLAERELNVQITAEQWPHPVIYAELMDGTCQKSV